MNRLLRFFDDMDVVAGVLDGALGLEVGVRLDVGVGREDLAHQVLELRQAVRVVRQPELMTPATA